MSAAMVGVDLNTMGGLNPRTLPLIVFLRGCCGVALRPVGGKLLGAGAPGFWADCPQSFWKILVISDELLVSNSFMKLEG